jgi:multidrug resistance efflux pump
LVPGAKASQKIRLSGEELWEHLSSAATSDFFAQSYLELQCRLIPGAIQGILLLGPPDRGPFTVAAVWPEDKQPTHALLDGAEKAISRRKGLISGAAAAEAAAEGGEIPVDLSLVAYPIQLSGRLHGALVLQVKPRSEEELRALLQQLRWGAGWIDSLTRRTGGRPGMSRKARVEVVPNLLAATLEYDGFQGAATAFVTELATDLACDRVSVGFLRRGRSRLRAISHSSHSGKKTNLIRSIEAAMDEAIDQQATLVHPPPSEKFPIGAHAHAELARQHGVSSICTVPLVSAGRVCGAITLERPEGRTFDEQTVQLSEVAASLVGPVLEALRRDDRWLGAKIWDVLHARLRQLFGPRHVALKLTASVLVALLLFLGLVRGDYRVTADALLEPRLLRAIVAPFDGYIREAPVRPGDIVREGDLLGNLDDRDLKLEKIKWVSQRQQLRKQHRQAMASREASEVQILSASLREAEAELARIESRLSRIELSAPFDGVVITGDLSQQLGAPAQRGAVLFEVAPLDAYRVIVNVDESDIDEVEVGQIGHIVFSSLPSDSYEFRTVKITPVATAEEGVNYFRVEARLSDESTDLRPAIEGVAKIQVERRRLIWIWTHKAVDWVRLALWRWTP